MKSNEPLRLIISVTVNLFYYCHVLSFLLLQRYADHNIKSQVTLTNTVLSWIISIKSIFDGVPQTASQDTGVPGTSNVGEHSSEPYNLDDPFAAPFVF
jgi:hypothetical protein